MVAFKILDDFLAIRCGIKETERELKMNSKIFGWSNQKKEAIIN